MVLTKIDLDNLILDKEYKFYKFHFKILKANFCLKF